MRKYVGLWATFAALLLVFTAGSAMAGWQEDQAALFEQVPVKPGDKIDSSNWQKVQDLLPSSVVEYVKKGDFILDVAQLEWDFNPDASWQKASAANAGKYVIGPEGEIQVKATGESPGYVYGDPFPYAQIDWKNDPKAASKIIYNATLKSARVGTVKNPFYSEWVGRSGLERSVRGDWFAHYYWSRPDGQIDNPAGFLLTEMNHVKEPYDLSGIISMNLRTINNKPDQGYSYVPAIRRVKKVSGTTRSSPFLGSDFVLDDTQGWYGKNETMTWKVLDKKIILLPVTNWAVKGPAKFTKQADGSWAQPAHLASPKNGHQIEGWKGAPWAPVDMKWVPREMYIIEAMPKDPYYNYGRTVYYVDPVSGFAFKKIHDKAGEYWKTLIVAYTPAQWGADNKITFSSAAYYNVIDDKSDHASICNCFGMYRGQYQEVVYLDPNVNQRLFSPTAMSALSK